MQTTSITARETVRLHRFQRAGLRHAPSSASGAVPHGSACSRAGGILSGAGGQRGIARA
jgi:hypothetical protein